MTQPRQSAGQPPFDDMARQAISAARGHPPQPKYVQPQQVPLSPEDRAEAEKAAARDRVCRLCLGYHALSELNGPGCPRLASFTVDGQGRLTGGSFWPGKAWAKGRVVFAEDVHEKENPDDR